MLRLSLAFSAALALAPALSAQAVSVPAEVTEVCSFGAWEDGDVAGHYRAVVTVHGFEHVHNELHLEWVAEDEAGARVVAAVPVREVNEPGVLVFGAGEPVIGGGGAFLEIPVRNAYTLEEATVRLRVGKPGEYAVVEAVTAG